MQLQHIYQRLRETAVVVGLTGAVGSGCTESAKFLAKKELSNDLFTKIENSVINNITSYDNLEIYRLRKIKFFLDEKGWKDFFHLKLSDLLFCIFFAGINEEKKIDYKVDDWLPNKEKLQEAKNLSRNLYCLIKNNAQIKESNTNSVKITKKLNMLGDFIRKNVKKKRTNYTNIFQRIGSELRENGLSIHIKEEPSKETNVFTLTEFAVKAINLLQKEGINFITVDALRNTYEINYMKASFSNFYLFSLNSERKIREGRLMRSFGYTSNDINKIQSLETEEKKFHSQNINTCISNGDVFVSNNTNKEHLYYHFLKYVCLIRKPGLFTPTTDERNMQIALTARYNSGCISRQVGACVTGREDRK